MLQRRVRSRCHFPLLGVFFLGIACAPNASAAPCFDFSTKVTTLIRKPVGFKPQEDIQQSQTIPDEKVWSSISAIVDGPIQKVVDYFVDPMAMRDANNTKIVVNKVANKNYFLLNRVEVEIRPVFFVTVNWTEEWAYALLEGTAAKPKRVLISYEKTAGTEHLPRKCGQVSIDANGKDKTKLFLYEEIKSSRWTEEDAVKHVRNIVKRVRTALGAPAPASVESEKEKS